MNEAISDAVWERLEAEFSLPSLEQVRARLELIHNDPEPVMQQLVRVFIGDGTFCPGYQFRPDGSLHPVVIELFDRALALQVPHNFFAVWMITPLPGPRIRPVDSLDRLVQLAAELSAFARRITPRPPRC